MLFIIHLGSFSKLDYLTCDRIKLIGWLFENDHYILFFHVFISIDL